MSKEYVKLGTFSIVFVVIFPLFGIALVRKTGLDCKQDLCKSIEKYIPGMSEEEISKLLNTTVWWCGTNGVSYSSLEELRCNRRCKSGPDLLYFGECKPEDSSTQPYWETQRMAGW